LRVERIYLTKATWPLRLAVLAAAMTGIAGCMSSPADELASVQTLPAPRKAIDQASFDARFATADATQRDRAGDPSEIAVQAARDADLLNRQPSLDGTDSQNAGIADAAQPAARNIAATQNSIFSSTSTKSGRLVADATAVSEAEATAPGMNAALGSIYSAQVEPVGDTAAIPLPDAAAVSEVQDLALAGMEIPDELAAKAADADAARASAPEETKTVALQPRSRSLQAIEPVETAEIPAEKPATNPKKRRLTLADFFRRKSDKTETASFDDTRFGRTKTRTLTTSAIPNMKTASLSGDALPGVRTANAMLPVGENPADEHGEESEEPVGLMKLASLSGMARMAPNGLWLQTDKVAISCLRPQLVSMLKQVEKHYGRPVMVTSGFRDGRHNRRAGGARHSLHTLCAAADIQIDGVSKWALADYLRSIPGRGGVGTYCHTQSVHIDIGDERDWNWRCRRTKRRG
jgi:uncharacterized protein YcbK (DUF882 family)